MLDYNAYSTFFTTSEKIAICWVMEKIEESPRKKHIFKVEDIVCGTGVTPPTVRVAIQKMAIAFCWTVEKKIGFRYEIKVNRNYSNKTKKLISIFKHDVLE